MADLSAGGLSIRGVEGFDVGEEVRCIFELPGQLRFDLFARVVRCGGSGDRGRVPESDAMYDSDMAVYINGQKRRKRHKNAARIKANIAVMKKWKAEGK